MRSHFRSAASNLPASCAAAGRAAARRARRNLRFVVVAAIVVAGLVAALVPSEPSGLAAPSGPSGPAAPLGAASDAVGIVPARQGVGARARLAAGAAVRAAVRRARRNLRMSVVAAVVVAGLVAGLVAALVPSGPAAPMAEASDTATATASQAAAGQSAAPASGTPYAQQAVPVRAGKTQAGKAQNGKAQTGKAQTGKAAARKQAAKAAPAHKQADKPYAMYDSVTPSKIPSGHKVATYATGKYAVSPSQVSGSGVTWIDTNGTDPKHSSVLDVEPGNVSPAFAATWVEARLTAHPTYTARVYTMLSEWPATKAAIATLPRWMQSHVKWWIADPTGFQHVVPGSDATQWYWGTNYDISTVNPGF